MRLTIFGVLNQWRMAARKATRKKSRKVRCVGPEKGVHREVIAN